MKTSSKMSPQEIKKWQEEMNKFKIRSKKDMENSEREIGRFNLGISLIQYNNGKIIPRFANSNLNIPKDIIITKLRLFLRILEDNYYSDFRNDVTTINFGPDE